MRPRWFISIRWWLPAAFALIAAVTALAVAQVFQSQSHRALRAKAEDLAAGSAVGASLKIAAATTLDGQVALADEQSRRRMVAFFLFDTRGRLLSAPTSGGVTWSAVPRGRELVRNALVGRRTLQSLEDGRRVTVGLPLRNGPAAALVEVAARPDLLEASSVVRNSIWVSAAWATLIGALAGVLVSLLITMRVRRIGGAAEAIAEGEFGSGLSPRFPDELGRLATAVDTMRRKLRASFGQLESERDRLRALVEQLQEGVIAVREDLTVVVANARASTLLGDEVEEGKPLANPWPTADLRAMVHRLFADETTALQTMRVAPAADHSYAVTGVPAAGSGSAVIVITDVTEQHRRERAEREFVANAAHELRTPLTAIASAVEVLQLGAKEQPAERDRFLALIERQTSRLGRLGGALLTLARAQSRAEHVQLEPVDVAQLLHELVADLDLPTTTLDLEDDVVALAHADLLRQAVENLIANARKYASSQGLVVSARESDEDDTVVVEVRDRGPGLTPAHAERAMERFFRSGDRDAEGFGLGLSIAREVVHALEGRLELESRPGEGTTARIVLGRAAGSAGAEPDSDGDRHEVEVG
jgi:signal transduction histidine kinase